MNPLVSVIVPAYNAEKSIDGCINSIRDQIYENIEIIVVNDGSTDGTEEKLMKIAKKDVRVKIVNQANAGVSSARNRGIDESNGEYLAFVDSDDVVSKHYIEFMMEDLLTSNSDLSICEMIASSNKNKHFDYIYKKGKNYNKHDFILNLEHFLSEMLVNSMCCKIYKASIIKNKDLKLLKDLDMGEDLWFNLDYINCIDNISIFNSVLYIYNNQDSYLTPKFRKNLFDLRSKSIRHLKKFLDENNVNAMNISDQYIKLFFAEVMSNLNSNSNMNFVDRRNRILELLSKDEIIDSLTKSSNSTQFQLLKNIAKTRNVLIIECFARILSFIRKIMPSYKRVSI